MHLSMESLLALAGGVVFLLVLFHLHVYAEFLGRKQAWLTAAGAGFLLFFAVWHLENQAEHQRGGGRIAVFPLILNTADSHQPTLAPASLALPDLLATLSADSAWQSWFVMPQEWLFASLDHDSLQDSHYQARVAETWPVPYWLHGSLSMTSDALIASLTLQERGTPDLAASWQIRAPAGNWTVLAGMAADSLRRFLGLPAEKNAGGWQLPEPDYAAARFALLTGDHATARQQTDRALLTDSSHAGWWQMHAQLLLLDKIGEKPAKQRDLLLQAASEKLGLFSDRDTTNAELARLAAETFFWRNKFNLAAIYLDRSLRLRPRDSQNFVLLSRLHYSRYRPRGYLNEVEVLEQALHLNPANIEAILALASVLVRLDKTDRAQKVLEHASAILPQNAQILRALGEVYVLRGLTEQVFETYQRLLAEEPDNTEAFYNLGIYYYHAGDNKTAEQFFKKAIGIDNHANSRLYLARLAEQRGDSLTAIRYLRQRIRLRKNEEDVYAEEARRHLFDLMLASGRVDSAGNLRQQK